MNRIRELRQQNGWTQDYLATRLNTKRQAVGHYETGIRGIDAQTILQLCDIFGCTADYLLGRTATGGLKLTPEEESTILALRRADERARSIIDVALEPFREDTAQEQREA